MHASAWQRGWLVRRSHQRLSICRAHQKQLGSARAHCSSVQSSTALAAILRVQADVKRCLAQAEQGWLAGLAFIGQMPQQRLQLSPASRDRLHPALTGLHKTDAGHCY